MITVTILKKEYSELVDKKRRYEYLRQIMEGEIFASPPTKKSGEVLRAFRETRKYSQTFLKSLEKGLRRSSHFN